MHSEAKCNSFNPAAQAEALLSAGLLPPDVTVVPVDANARWARPGPRLVDGVEELAAVLHPHP